jgi:octopine/nopaline transport system substrate-binding protein
MRVTKILALAVFGSGLALNGAAAQGKIWDTVRIATEGAYPPWNFSRPDGTLDGFEIELANDLCARMRVKCQIVAQDWDGMIPALNAGKYDAVMAGMDITEKRLEILNFSRPYANEPASFGVGKSGPLAKLPGDGVRYDLTANPAEGAKVIEAMKPFLKGLTIGVQVSTNHAVFLDTYLRGAVEVRAYKTTQQHDLDLLAGRIDAIFGSMSALRAAFENADFADFKMAGAQFSGGVFGRGAGVGLRKSDPELKRMFDDAIAAAIAEGTLQKLSLKWFKADLTPKD